MSRAQSNERRYSNARDIAQNQQSGSMSNTVRLPDGVPMYKTKEGVAHLDILPFIAGKHNPVAEKGVWHYERTYFVHRGIGANGETHVCAAMTFKKPCPICEHRMKLRKMADPESEDLIKDLAPKQRQLFLVRDARDPDKGTMLWDVSFHLFGKLLMQRLRDAEEEDKWHRFFFLEGGMTLKLSFVEKSYGGRSFYEVQAIDFKERREDYDEKLIEESPCLDSLIIVPDYEKLKSLFLEDGSQDEEPKSKRKAADDEDEDDDEPKAKVKAKKPVDDDDDDEDEEPKSKSKKPAADDDDDDEPWPERKPKAKKPSDDDDDDEDEEPKSKSRKPAADDDDDEDEEPKSKSKRKAADDEDEEDDEPKAKAKKPADDDDDDEDEPRPKAKRHPAEDEDEDDDEPKPRVRTRDEILDEDEDEPKPRRKRH